MEKKPAKQYEKKKKKKRTRGKKKKKKQKKRLHGRGNRLKKRGKK